jgi:rhamnose utilization protein RhaD (predicted bifunctional aldolase and dehydrogenase)
VILAEGNCSASAGDTFWIKASGAQMALATPEDYVEVFRDPLLEAIADDDSWSDARCREVLNAARVDHAAPGIPSTEAFMHAWLLELPFVAAVAHTHPESLLSLLVMADAEEMARTRLFPDEIVCCGPSSIWVPYVAPGLPLARAIRDAVYDYRSVHPETPKTIWLQNHGLIALGTSPADALAATLMTEKAARIRLGCLAAGRDPIGLDEAEIAQIAGWPDEHYRQNRLRAD